MRYACVREAIGCTSRRGGQCDGVPTLHMSMCSDCLTIEPGSLALWSGCRFADKFPLGQIKSS